MRASFFLRIVLFVTTAWAGGYQFFVELQVHALAYEIDGLRDASDRTIGFKCDKSGWDDQAKKCTGTWKQFSSSGPRANIQELLYQAAGFQKPHPNLARDSNNNPISAIDCVDKIDLEVTATNMFNQTSNELGSKPKDQVKT